MRRILLIALPSFAVVTMVLALSACGFERSAFDWFDVQPAEDAQSQHASSGPSASSENSAQEKREIEASGEWARGIVADSLQKLADEHAIDPVPDAKEGKAPFEGVFRFEMDKNTLLKGKDRIFPRSIKLILIYGIGSVLSCELAFKLHRYHWNTIYKKNYIYAVFILK